MAEYTVPECTWKRSRYPLQKASGILVSPELAASSARQHSNQEPDADYPFDAALEGDAEPQEAYVLDSDPGERDPILDSELSVKDDAAGRRSLRRTKRSWHVPPSAASTFSEDRPVLNRSIEIERTLLGSGSPNEPNKVKSSDSSGDQKSSSSSETGRLCSSVGNLSRLDGSISSSQSSVAPNLDQALASLGDLSSHPDAPQSQAIPAKAPGHRRQVYPLQSLASVETLRRPQTPPSPVPKKEDGQAASAPENRYVPVLQKSKAQKASRTTYPLQSFASIANLQRPPSPPSSPDSAFRRSSGSFPERDSDIENTPAETKTYRRQAYPLQTYPSVADLQSSPSTLTSTSMMPLTDPAGGFQGRERALAAEAIWRWHRQTYPLQSLDNPGASGLESESDPCVPIHLPKHIRAVADAKGHDDSSGRTIVVCLDGTGDKFDNDNSNIVHLISALKKDDARQVTYYQAGIGTYGAGGLSGGVTAAMDMAIGSGLGMHVREAYHFLMHTYKEGDKICIFGFSRGAYTARCLAGMIHKVGLLPARNVQQIPFAYEFYKDSTLEGWEQSGDFKKAFCIDVNVYFLGCFDSVASVGFIPRQLPLSSTPNNKPRYFRHAMALDERRAKFKVCRHQNTDWDDIKKMQKLTAKSTYGKNNHPGISDKEYEELRGEHAPFESDVLEVWFAGAHADVGGGAVANAERHKLAQIPLRWMIREAFKCNTGIIFKSVVLAEYGLDVHTLWPIYADLPIPDQGPSASVMDRYYYDGLPPKSVRCAKLVPIDKKDDGEQLYHLKSHTDPDWTPEQLEDCFDAISPMHDQLVQVPNWWILEFLPVEYKVPTTPGNYDVVTGMNLGRYRAAEDAKPKMHWTVQYRSQHLGYKIQARTAVGSKWESTV